MRSRCPLTPSNDNGETEIMEYVGEGVSLADAARFLRAVQEAGLFTYRPAKRSLNEKRSAVRTHAYYEDLIPVK